MENAMTPQLIRQPKYLRLLPAWQRGDDLPEEAQGYEEFMGIKTVQTTPLCEFPDNTNPDHFLTEEVYEPCAGPIKEYDANGRLTDEGTLIDDNGDLRYAGQRSHYYYAADSDRIVAKDVIEYRKNGLVKKACKFDANDILRWEWLFDTNERVFSQKIWDGQSQLVEYKFLSKQGDVYRFVDWWGDYPKEEKDLIKDNIAGKKADRKARIQTLKKIRKAYRRGDKNAAQTIRKEFESQLSAKRQRSFLSRLFKHRENCIE